MSTQTIIMHDTKQRKHLLLHNVLAAPSIGTDNPAVVTCSSVLLPLTQVERPEQLKEIVPQKRLADKVSGILSRIEAELDAVDEKIGERMHILDLDNDGLVRHCLNFSLTCSTFAANPTGKQHDCPHPTSANSVCCCAYGCCQLYCMHRCGGDCPAQVFNVFNILATCAACFTSIFLLLLCCMFC